MDFETWFKQHVPNAPAGKYHELLDVWEAATKAERERCARLVTTGDYCRYVDHNNGTCDCADMAAAIRAS